MSLQITEFDQNEKSRAITGDHGPYKKKKKETVYCNRYLS